MILLFSLLFYLPCVYADGGAGGGGDGGGGQDRAPDQGHQDQNQERSPLQKSLAKCGPRTARCKIYNLCRKLRVLVLFENAQLLIRTFTTDDVQYNSYDFFFSSS